ncbi:hypothetical protein APHAL10511_004869 [Amanita phalloides]|nr:hypothetical protein APHAL10511_004869 [Amanita phalloides]
MSSRVKLAGKLSGPRTSPTATKTLESNQQSSSTTPDTTSSPGTEADGVPREAKENPPENGAGGAFNPETGEINWDCPCLGGMAHGPCGLQFREAFSCFVFSEVEPKGMDCIEKFKAMQDCFREHPDVYADEIMDDEESSVSDEQSSADEKEKDANSLPQTKSSPDDSSSSTPS